MAMTTLEFVYCGSVAFNLDLDHIKHLLTPEIALLLTGTPVSHTEITSCCQCKSSHYFHIFLVFISIFHKIYLIVFFPFSQLLQDRASLLTNHPTLCSLSP